VRQILREREREIETEREIDILRERGERYYYKERDRVK
jgi:hypothetical protein